LIESLKLKHLKRGDLELEFEQEISQLKGRIESTVVTTSTSKARLLKEADPQSQMYFPVDNQLELISEINPAAGIALAWSNIEREIQATAIRLKISSDLPPWSSTSHYIAVLKNSKFIDENLYEVIDRLRKLRNVAIHAMFDSGLTVQQAREFAEVSRGVLKTLNSLHRK
jgi:hypothetical protein